MCEPGACSVEDVYLSPFRIRPCRNGGAATLFPRLALATSFVGERRSVPNRAWCPPTNAFARAAFSLLIQEPR